MIKENALNFELMPFFLEGTKGNIFCLFAPPADKQNEVLIFLPSFGEELNRSRAMVAMQSRILAGNGIGSLLIDFYGTGDSEGDFEETSWFQWSQDVLSANKWLNDQGYQNVGLWGLRLGAILAAETVSENPKLFNRLLLWQPVIDGKILLTQFFRIRLAMLMDRGEPKETTAQMREILQQGEHIEVAGYKLTSQLAQGLDSKKLIHVKQFDKKIKIDWLELVLDENSSSLAMGSQKVIDKWLEYGQSINVHTFFGPAFWQLHEREITPNLLLQTTAIFK